jgi:hypothetical protein
VTDAPGPINLKALIEEAAAETYNPRAKRCWWWSHEWTMWQADASGRSQTRRCVGCGRIARKVLAAGCSHSWVTESKHDIMDAKSSVTLRVGVAYYQRCICCGDHRRERCAP